jgi:hypothetical protein
MAGLAEITQRHGTTTRPDNDPISAPFEPTMLAATASQLAVMSKDKAELIFASC